jgi:hypothetical protein
LKSVV